MFQIWKFEPSVPFLVATLAAKDMKCASFPNLALSTPMALTNIFPMFNSSCLRLSKADIDSTFNSYLIPYLFHIFCCLLCFLYNCINIFCNEFTFFYTSFWLNPSDWFISCHVIASIFLVYSNSRRRAFAQNVEILLIYILGSCIPTNESLYPKFGTLAKKCVVFVSFMYSLIAWKGFESSRVKIFHARAWHRYSQKLTVTKQLPELEASLEVSFGLPKFELSTAITASGTWKNGWNN